ncbi:MAG: hypothetical protein U5L45_25775 [Saprospiraceae bacterium]|nr:hypothetical protein [Saprospiraceae bacterium]
MKSICVFIARFARSGKVKVVRFSGFARKTNYLSFPARAKRARD